MDRKLRIVKVKKGQEAIRKELRLRLARKEARVDVLIQNLNADKEIALKPKELDKIALELRHLAFQIRTYKLAVLATEEA